MPLPRIAVVVVPFVIFLVLTTPDYVSARFTTVQIEALGRACHASAADLAVAKAYQVPTTQSGKCLMKCMINKLKLLNIDGTYNKKGVELALKQYWPEWPLDKILLINSKCFDESKRVPLAKAATCDYAYEVMACINTQAKELNIL
ncbi:Pheromone/general odorant binding protein [Cinara cedri]|uniref:Pheromone/general odorant binding protein n=1 Tax=Cinara cedri TaxID=506608 RepID=A0A5E4NG70_9HEMI|nr:Pheromone/general odorant binding protein [Cinara cedri]